MTVPPPSSDPVSLPGAPVRQLVARVHRGRRSGVVEVQVGEETRRLVMRQGELFLAPDHPLARALAPLLPSLPPRPGRPDAAAQVRGMMARIAFHIGSWSGAARFLEGEGVGGAMVGPLPTRLLLMEWAAERGPEAVLALLGGEDAELVAVESDDEAAALTVRLLDPQAAVLRSRLTRPTRVADLLRQAGGSPTRVLADLVRLQAAGLIGPRPETEPAGAPAPSVGPALAPDLLRGHLDRVARDLAARPLALDAGSHRSRLEEIASEAESGSPYRLLGVEADAGVEEVEAAYHRLARLAHPSHAGQLGIADVGRLRRLFERLTAAFLTLSQPGRRSRSDLELAPVPAPAGQGPEEARQLARSYYERAEALIEAEDFHFAVELLRQAVSSHPRPEYYVLLGRVQAKNPNWLRHAVDSYRRALDLGADDPRVSVALGRLCEEMDQLEEAERHYRAAVARDPLDTDARAGLARLTGGGRRPGDELGRSRAADG